MSPHTFGNSGGLVTIESPQLATQKQRNRWRAGLIAFGIVVSLITFAQQQFARTETQKQFALNYVPSGLLVYENKRFIFYNKGKSSLYFWGDKLGDGTKKDLTDKPRIIPKDANYYLFGDKFEELALRNIGPNGESMVPFEMYFKNELGVKFVSTFTLLVRVKNGIIEVHTQMLSFDPHDW